MDQQRIQSIMKFSCNIRQLIRIGEDSSDSSVYSFLCNNQILIGKVLKNGPSLAGEYKLMRRLSSSGIVPQVKLFKDEIIIMQHVPMTLARWLTVTDIDDMYGIAANLVSKLKRFHELGYTHGDMHTNNILVDPVNIECYLIDFTREHRGIEPIDNLESLRETFYSFPLDMAMNQYGYQTEKYNDIKGNIEIFDHIYVMYVQDMYGITLQQQQQQKEQEQ